VFVCLAVYQDACIISVYQQLYSSYSSMQTGGSPKQCKKICACALVCACVCVRACACVCICACVCVCLYVWVSCYECVCCNSDCVPTFFNYGTYACIHMCVCIHCVCKCAYVKYISGTRTISHHPLHQIERQLRHPCPFWTVRTPYATNLSIPCFFLSF